MNLSEKYKSIVAHYEDCLDKHGDSHLGVDWPKIEDVERRHEVMLDLIYLNKDSGKVSLLDFGCGAAHLYESISKWGLDKQVQYTGFDASEKFVALCKTKFPDLNFFAGDALSEKFSLGEYDYVVMNGVFTEKRGLTFDEMWEYFQQLITVAFQSSRKGIAFNVMSKHVDWERDDLFHVPMDLLADFLCKKLSRHFVMRNDYKLFEFTTYVYKK